MSRRRATSGMWDHILDLPGALINQRHKTRDNDVIRVRTVTHGFGGAAHDQIVGGVLETLILDEVGALRPGGLLGSAEDGLGLGAG